MPARACTSSYTLPLSREFDTNMTVKARFRPCHNPFFSVPLSRKFGRNMTVEARFRPCRDPFFSVKNGSFSTKNSVKFAAVGRTRHIYGSRRPDSGLRSDHFRAKYVKVFPCCSAEGPLPSNKGRDLEARDEHFDPVDRIGERARERESV